MTAPVGSRGAEMAQALAALEAARAELLARLEVEPAWQAMRQLEQREASGEKLDAVDSTALRARLGARLDASAPSWRALASIEAAIATLQGPIVETAAVAGSQPGGGAVAEAGTLPAAGAVVIAPVETAAGVETAEAAEALQVAATPARDAVRLRSQPAAAKELEATAGHSAAERADATSPGAAPEPTRGLAGDTRPELASLAVAPPVAAPSPAPLPLAEGPPAGAGRSSPPPLPLPSAGAAAGRPTVIADEAVALRNRSLVEAIGALQALGGAGQTDATAGKRQAPPPDTAAADASEAASAQDVLARIRTIDGERTQPPPGVVRHGPTPPALRPRHDAPAVPMPPALATPAPTAGEGEVPAAGAATKADRRPPPLPTARAAAVAPVAGDDAVLLPAAAALPAERHAAPTVEPEHPVEPDRAAAKMVLPIDIPEESALRVAAMERELDRLMQRNIEARRPRAAPRPAAPWMPTADATDLDEIFLEEAEIEIVPLATATAKTADPPAPAQPAAAESRDYAAYQGVIDEASVEIVLLDERAAKPEPNTSKPKPRPRR